jgi:hypothetical protein
LHPSENKHQLHKPTHARYFARASVVADMSSTASESPALLALTSRQAQVALALARGVTITAAAAAVGLNRCTIHRWLCTAKFQETVRQSRADFILALREGPKTLRAHALATLDARLADPATPTGERLRLALVILSRRA